ADQNAIETMLGSLKEIYFYPVVFVFLLFQLRLVLHRRGLSSLGIDVSGLRKGNGKRRKDLRENRSICFQVTRARGSCSGSKRGEGINSQCRTTAPGPCRSGRATLITRDHHPYPHPSTSRFLGTIRSEPLLNGS